MAAMPLAQPNSIEKDVTTFKPRGVCHRPIITGTELVEVSRFDTRKSWIML